jgi:hypothetical protein
VTQPPAARTLGELTESFNALGSVILNGPEEFGIFMHHVRRNNIPTQTDVDREAGTVTIFKRAWGTMEV